MNLDMITDYLKKIIELTVCIIVLLVFAILVFPAFLPLVGWIILLPSILVLVLVCVCAYGMVQATREFFGI